MKYACSCSLLDHLSDAVQVDIQKAIAGRVIGSMN